MTLKGQVRVSDAPAAGHVLTTTAVGESNVDVGTGVSVIESGGSNSRTFPNLPLTREVGSPKANSEGEITQRANDFPAIDPSRIISTVFHGIRSIVVFHCNVALSLPQPPRQRGRAGVAFAPR